MKTKRLWILWGLGGLFAVLAVRNAWLSDDAYITFRTVDNFIHGYGLTWNVGERVQTYTHPLWMLLLSACAWATHEIYFTSLILSLSISLLAVALMVRYGARDTWTAALGLTVFILSKAAVDYATSGLENPLTTLLLVLFFSVYAAEQSTQRCFRLALLASLGVVNRMDTALLYLPPLAWAFWQQADKKSALRAYLLGSTPFWLWEAFSLFYYGFPFPNTAYAKLNTGLISRATLLRAGWDYLRNSAQVDPVTLTSITAGFLAPFVTRQWRRWPISAGLALSVAYVVYIGGDFMSGRFLTAPLVAAVMALVTSRWPSLPRLRVSGAAALWLLLASLGLSAPYAPLRSGGATSAESDPRWVVGRGICDERANYYHNTGLLERFRRHVPLPDHDWAMAGRQARAAGKRIAVLGSVGFYGYFAGPSVHVVDLLGLGDPLLARLPVTDPTWRIGHLGRIIPPGYLETLEQGTNQIADPHLARYYDKLSLLTQGPLWEPRRWAEIWHFNTGAYDDELRAYAYRRAAELEIACEMKNVPGRGYVYAYVWNHQAGEAWLLDDASQSGQRYTFRWHVTAEGVTFEGDARRQLSVLPGLTDEALLNVGGLFSERESLDDYEAVEWRYWFRIAPDGSLLVVQPAREWLNRTAPQGFWESPGTEAAAIQCTLSPAAP